MPESGIDQNVARFGRFHSHAATHTGTVRQLNEDSFVNRPDLGLWAVADGAGGHESGEVASAEIAGALQTIGAGLSASQVMAEVRARLDTAHAYLRAAGASRGPGVLMASTVVVLLVRGDHFACLWAGDSRAYLLRGQELMEVTRDHSLVQELVDAGTITAAEAEHHPHANVITRAVGADCDVLDLEKRTGRLIAGDRLLLCSDGLCKTLPKAQIAELLANKDGPGAEGLIQAALAAQVHDNVTAITIDCAAADNSPG